MALSVSDVNTVLQADTVHNNVRQPLQRRAKGKAVAARSTLADVKNRTASRSLRFNKTGKLPVKSKPSPEETVHEAKPEVAVPAVQDIPLPPPGVTNIDEEEENPQLCHEYAPLLYHYLREIEASQPIRKDFLKNCHVNGKMRAVLIDWLVEVHAQFKLLPETLYMTIFMIDRYLQAEGLTVKRNRFQLLGVTAMFTASKVEEMYAPEINDFVYITDNAYTAQEIRQMELKVLQALNFEVCRPLPLHFLRRFSKAGDVDVQHHTLAKYIIELAQIDYPMASLPPSLVAASSLFLSLLILVPDGDVSLWNSSLEYYSLYTADQLLATVAQLAVILAKAGTAKLKAVYNKYSAAKMMKVALLPELEAGKNTILSKLASKHLASLK